MRLRFSRSAAIKRQATQLGPFNLGLVEEDVVHRVRVPRQSEREVHASSRGPRSGFVRRGLDRKDAPTEDRGCCQRRDEGGAAPAHGIHTEGIGFSPQWDERRPAPCVCIVRIPRVKLSHAPCGRRTWRLRGRRGQPRGPSRLSPPGEARSASTFASHALASSSDAPIMTLGSKALLKSSSNEGVPCS